MMIYMNTTTSAPAAKIPAGMPTPRLMIVMPAAAPTSVSISKDDSTIRWTDTDGAEWEAYAEDEIDAYAVCTPNGEYGEEEEDYALVAASDLLNVIAHGINA